MFRRIVGGMALAAVVATGASAQFKISNGSNSGFTFVSGTVHKYDTFKGQFNVNNPQTGVGTSVFQVFCVDEDHLITPGDDYNVWVTPLSGGASTFSNTRVPAGEPLLYQEAAVLADQMLVGNSNTQAYNENLEYAMWEIMGYAAPTTHQDYDAGLISSDKTYAAGHLSDITMNDWLVITVAPTSGPFQEFLYNAPGRPKDVTPEPATMAMLATGLVGMAGAGLRRRRRK